MDLLIGVGLFLLFFSLPMLVLCKAAYNYGKELENDWFDLLEDKIDGGKKNE